jgi:CRP/FNR family cyclic AMP-dependent transcriptional regulator
MEAVVQTLDTLTELIKTHPFLAGLAPEFYEFLDGCATLRRFASQTFVPGCGTVTIQRVGPKQALGWSWLFPPHQWHFTATTLTPTEVISFDAEALCAKAAENRDFRDELLTRVSRTLLERLQSTRMQLIDLYTIRH